MTFKATNGKIYEASTKKALKDFLLEEFPNEKISFEEYDKKAGDIIINVLSLQNLKRNIRDECRRAQLFLKDDVTPHRLLKVGDEVDYGHNMGKWFVSEVYENGKVYVIVNESKNDFRVLNWVDTLKMIKPRTEKIFTKKDLIFVNYSNTQLKGLLNRIYFFGANMNPKYQRDLVWSESDKIALIDSIFENLDIGKFVFVENKYKENEMLFEILDGKQRLNAVKEFIEDRFKYNGFYFSELHPIDQQTIFTKSVAYADVDRRHASEDEIVKYFVMLNKGGVTMSKEHLEKIEKEYGLSN